MIFTVTPPSLPLTRSVLAGLLALSLVCTPIAQAQAQSSAPHERVPLEPVWPQGPNPQKFKGSKPAKISKGEKSTKTAKSTKDKTGKKGPNSRNPYPFPGPIIQPGEDIPLCAAIKDPETYKNKKAYRFILEGKDGWLFRSVDFKQNFSADPLTKHYFKMLNAALAMKGQKLVIALQPSRGFMSEDKFDPASVPAGYDAKKAKESFRDFIKELNDMGIPSADMTEIPQDLEYFIAGDLHWTVEGAKWSAGVVADQVKSLPLYDDLKKTDFVTESIPYKNDMRGVYYEFVQRTCQINIAMQPIKEWVTTAATTQGEVDLFGDVPFPEVVLLGTSNSAFSFLNFVGWLKENLRTDIYNVAIAGGGFGSSIVRYLASDEYLQYPPKLLFWEFLAQHNYNASDSHDDFRQAIPAAIGECSDQDAVDIYAAPISSKSTDLKSFSSKPLKDTYLFIEANGPIERELQMEILYDNGQGGFAELTRDSKVPNNGKYFFLLDAAEDDDPNADHKPIFIRLLTDKAEGNYRVKVCPLPKQLTTDTP